MPVQTIREKSINHWLVLGAFPHPEQGALLGCPFLPEADLAPSAGDRVGGRAWQTVSARRAVLDLLALNFEPSVSCVAYAFAYVHAARACRARFAVGSGDGVAVWVNGREVWRNNCGRALTIKQDRFAADLDYGWNRLLLKVSQYVGGWAVSCHIEAPVSLRFGIKNPHPQRWTGPTRQAMAPALMSLSVTGAASAGKALVACTVFNRAPKAQAGLEVRLAGPAGDPVASVPLARVESFRQVSGKVEVDALVLARAAAGLQAAVAGGARQTAQRLPVGFASQALFALVPMLVSDPEARGLAARAQVSVATFPAPLAALDEAARRTAFAALASGDVPGLRAALRTLTDLVLSTQPDRKGDKVHVVGHAHIDMNWLWTYQETVQSCHDTFRQVIAFMDEYKDFTFLQSQASTYVAVEAYDPALFARIRARVQEGRWELAGGMYSEGDTNLSGGEALARSFLLGQRYFLDRFGRTATVGWLPDNFGHASQLPQILRLAGCEFFYFHRCQPHFGTFWWEGPDGSRVLCYSNDNYNGKVTAGVAANIERIVPEKRRLLEVCGVGDHGGGPTRADIEHAQSLNATPRFPSVAWTSAERFFRDSAAESVGRPVHRGEMQYIFEGCYTTIARIKEGNRRCEAALYTAEWLACLRRLAGDAYPAEDLRRAWEIVTFNQFHDILCGSAIHESNADSAADYKWALARAESVSGHALRRLADQVAFDRSLGQPLVVANPHPRPVTSLVEAEVFTHDPPVTVSRLSFWSEFYDGNRIGAEPGVLPTVCLRDHAGRAIPAQVVWGKDFPPGKRWRVLFKAEDLPAGGHRAYYLDAAKPGDCVLPLEEQQGRFDTEHLRVAFDMATGEIASLKDKRSGVEYAARCGGLNRLRILCEKPHGMSGWNIGPISKTEDVTDVVSVSVVERGPVRACVETVKRWGRSKFIQRTYLYRSYPRVDFELEVHWFEQGNAQVDAPMLQAVFPLRLKNPRFDCQTPFDVVSRPSTGQEVPAQQWVDVSDGKAGLALLNRTKYGHALKAAELTLTLLRSSYDPDIYPDQGLHRIAYSLFPHTGDWRNGVWNEGELFNVPPLAAEPPSFAWREGPATLPQETTGAVLEPGTVALSGIKESEDGRELVVRLVEVRGEAVTATLRLPARIRAARHLDLIERPLAGAPAVELVGGGIRVSLAPHQIVSVGLDVEQL